MNTAAIPALDVRRLVASLKDDATEVLRCPCGASRLVFLGRRDERQDRETFGMLHRRCWRPMSVEEIQRSA